MTVYIYIYTHYSFASNGLFGKFKGHTGRAMCSNEDNIKKCLKELG